jgi:hypothetical protein
MGKYYDHKKKYDLLIFKALLVFSTPDYGKVFCGLPSVWRGGGARSIIVG